MKRPAQRSLAEHALAKHLESTADEERISSLWSEIRKRRDHAAAAPRRPSARSQVGAASAVASAAAAGIALWLARPAPPPPAPGELRLANAALPDVLQTAQAAQAERVVSLSDRSRIAVAPGARLEVLQNDGEHFGLLLRHGRARFEVEPGGPRRWVIEAGLATVEVIGTVFVVEREERGVRVGVERGVVLVRGERVPDRVQRLTRGQSLFVEAEPEPASEAAQPQTAEVATPASAPPPAARPSDRVGDRVGDRAGDRVGEWLARADDARRAGRPEAAVAPLRRAMEADGDPRAALAAYTLGRIEQSQLGHPELAEQALRRALALGLPDRLAEQAERRLAEIHAARTEGAGSDAP
ncbi:MAG: FecR domain-containing protein [Sandaracinaceae bacterium]|nr:FecR domain-containing protein [Sandaracinaceae bacterium]